MTENDNNPRENQTSHATPIEQEKSVFKVCQVCLKPDGELFLCPRCKSIWYCSKDCQEKDSTKHDMSCEKIEKLNNDVGNVAGPGITMENMVELQRQWFMARFAVLHHLCRLCLRFWYSPEEKSRQRAALVKINYNASISSVQPGLHLSEAQLLSRLFTIDSVENVAAQDVARAMGWQDLEDQDKIEEGIRTGNYIMCVVVALRMGRFVVPLTVSSKSLELMPEWMKAFNDSDYDSMLENLIVQANEGNDKMGWDEYLQEDYKDLEPVEHQH